MKKGLIKSRNNIPGEGRQGSALLTAVIFSFLVTALMGSYLYLSTGEYRIATRSFLSNASFNLAEGGIDLALNAIQSKDNTGWITGTDGEGRSYWARLYDGYNLGVNITGEIKVVVLNPDSKTPEVYTEGLAKGHIVGDVKKQLYVNLNSGFFPFLNGFNTKDGILLKGNNITFDSYDSRIGAYGPGNINSEITISTTSVKSDAIDIGNANIYGYVATGASDPDVGPNGSITDYDNPGLTDESRITRDYYANFPDVEAPTLISPQTTMPSSGTIAGGEYLLESWSSNSSSPLYIEGDTTIVITGDMQLYGMGSIIIAPNADVKIYAEGDVALGGLGILNSSGTPSQLMIFGTNTTPGEQEMNVLGNGFLAAAVYAPNSAVSLNGGGSSGRIFGAIAARDADIVGNSHFSYDEALTEENIGGSSYEIDEWAEIVGLALTSLSLNMADYDL